MSRLWGYFEHFADDVVCRMAAAWLWCIPFQRATLQVQEEEDSTAAAAMVQHKHQLHNHSAQDPPTSTLKIELSTFLFQFAATNSDALYHDHNKKEKCKRHIWT